MEYYANPNQHILEDLGSRLKHHRLHANMSQSALAEKMGVALKTIQNLESGKNPTLETVVSALRGLNLLANLDQFIPIPGPSPIELAKRGGLERKRARTIVLKEPKPGEWKW
jgi:transcriptional regulator with XRE-family HTH domain